ncbi:universal stress protein [Nocardia sp. NPDC088792]|uniref:universal stress protein n=1 Tax=Nocardia sp. NPDC088792 TaxID=3364332 RepID=UPI0037F4B6E8
MAEPTTPGAQGASGFELGTDGPLVIVVGVDGSESSWRAAAYAGGLARRQRATLAVVYVQPWMPMVTAMGADVQALTSDIADELAQEIREAVERVEDVFTIRWKFLTRRGDPYTELAKAADELGADAVVVGASQQAGHRLIGSVAVRLVRSGRWPVTVVP